MRVFSRSMESTPICLNLSLLTQNKSKGAKIMDKQTILSELNQILEEVNSFIQVNPPISTFSIKSNRKEVKAFKKLSSDIQNQTTAITDTGNTLVNAINNLIRLEALKLQVQLTTMGISVECATDISQTIKEATPQTSCIEAPEPESEESQKQSTIKEVKIQQVDEDENQYTTEETPSQAGEPKELDTEVINTSEQEVKSQEPNGVKKTEPIQNLSKEISVTVTTSFGDISAPLNNYPNKLKGVIEEDSFYNLLIVRLCTASDMSTPLYQSIVSLFKSYGCLQCSPNAFRFSSSCVLKLMTEIYTHYLDYQPVN